MCGNDNSIGYTPAESSVSVLDWSTLPRVSSRPRFATGKIGEPDYASAIPLDAESRKAVMDGFNNFCLWHGIDFAGVACGKDSAKIVNVSQVKPATNEELGSKFENRGWRSGVNVREDVEKMSEEKSKESGGESGRGQCMSANHDFHPPTQFVKPQWLAGIEKVCRDFNERMRRLAEEMTRESHPFSKLIGCGGNSKCESVSKEGDEADGDIPDAEHPYMDETSPFSPAGQDKELPVDYRYRPTEKQWQYHGFPCPWGGTLPPPMPPVESEAMPSTESPVARDELDARIGALEFRFDELLKGVKAYNEKIADLISDVEMLKANSGSGPYS